MPIFETTKADLRRAILVERVDFERGLVALMDLSLG